MQTKWISKIEGFFRKQSPTILTCIGTMGVVATAVLSVKATPKAIELIRQDSRIRHDGDPNGYTKAEAVKSCWVCYIPAAITGTMTITCIFGANVLSKKKQASITSAYGLLNASYQKYKGKLKELYGEEGHQKVIGSIVKEEVKDTYIFTPGMMKNSSLDFDEHNPEDNRLFYDSFSKRYFETSINRVLQAEYCLNRNFILGWQVSVNEFYNFLGLEGIENGDSIGWDDTDICSEINWIDFDHSKAELDDGLECYIIDMVYYPHSMASLV